MPSRTLLSLIHSNAVDSVIDHSSTKSEENMRETWIIAMIAIVIAVPAIAQPQNLSSSSAPIKIIGSPQRGQALVERWCADCHHAGTDTSANDQVPSIRWIADQEKKDPHYIRAFLHRPHAPMPPLDLDRVEIEDIISYLESTTER